MADRVFLDAMLGKLATYLRMCGYDAAYALDRGVEADNRLLAIAEAEDRVLLTRDRQLAAQAANGLLLESRDVREQLRELQEAGCELTLATPPVRCGKCNGHLEAVAADDSTPSSAPDPAAESVWQCRDCDQYFWQGSHWEDVAETLSEL